MTSQNEYRPEDRLKRRSAIGMSIGITLGTAIGAATGNVALGLATGILVGGVGFAFYRWRVKKNKR